MEDLARLRATRQPDKAEKPCPQTLTKRWGAGVGQLWQFLHNSGVGVEAAPRRRRKSGTPTFAVLRPTFSACQNGCFVRVPNRDLAMLRGQFDMLLTAGPAKAVYPVKTIGGGGSRLRGIFHKLRGGVTAGPQMRSKLGSPKFTVLRRTFSP